MPMTSQHTTTQKSLLVRACSSLVARRCARKSAAAHAAHVWVWYHPAGSRAVNQDPLGQQGVRVAGGTLSGSSPASMANVWARPLADGSHAFAFLNTGPSAGDVTCDAACFAAAGLRDKVSHRRAPSCM